MLFRDHIIMKHEKSASHHCNICNGKFPSAIKFRDHMKKVHTKVTCEICEENFTRIQLKKHKATEHGIGSVQPDISKPFRCPFCPMAFKSKKGLQKHSEVKHDTEIEVEMEGSDMEIEHEQGEVETAIRYIEVPQGAVDGQEQKIIYQRVLN